jgi:hypothetical protein
MAVYLTDQHLTLSHFIPATGDRVRGRGWAAVARVQATVPVWRHWPGAHRGGDLAGTRPSLGASDGTHRAAGLYRRRSGVEQVRCCSSCC